MDEGDLLAAVLEHYDVALPYRSGNLSIRCPLHDDTHTSGSVDLSRGLWNCFVCGVGGDAYRLIQIKEEVGFVEAQRIAEGIARDGGVEIRERTRGESDDYLLPRKTRTRSGRKAQVSTWVRSLSHGGP